jgi:hypothetical protein
MIVSWKRPDALVQEVRAKKLKELSQYNLKSPTEKAKDIMSLLVAMKAVGSKKTALAS